MINPDNTPDASPDTAWLRAAFDQAGEPEPDSALWPRILHSHQRRRRWRALRRSALVCVLALTALAVPALWPGGEAMAPDVALRDVPASAELGRIELRSIDRQLEAAYARQDAARIEHLWRRREFLVQTLMENPDGPASSVISL